MSKIFKILFTVLIVLSIAGILIAGRENEKKKEEGSPERPYEGITLKVIAQHRLEYDVMEENLPEFEAETGIDVQIIYFGELDRRAKSRLDASTGAGTYQVYYLDEANVAEFAASDWVYPLLDYYPEEYDFDDFFEAYKNIGSYKGVNYFAPTLGGGDLFMYRKDILKNAGVAVPTTLDELKMAIKKLHNPPEIYGWVARGQRGSGMNVWRWAPFFEGFGGKWFDGENPIFNSSEAVKATEVYMELMEYAPPGTSAGDWSDAVEAFRAGKAVFIIETNVFRDWMEDPEKSFVVGKVGYAVVPSPLLSAGYAHGVAISKPGCKTEQERKAAGLYIAWFTSKEQEIKRIESDVFSAYGRKSTMEHPKFKAKVPEELTRVILDMDPITKLCIWGGPEWPEIGDNLGVILEELFTGTRTDIKAALDEAAEYASNVMAERRR
jgi:multiple sugar transport system substrate-binding protein